jgi:uncharacterized protein (TIGR02145 family)
LKSSFGWKFPYSYNGSGNGTNESGFNVIPAETLLYDENGFADFGWATSFWSSTQNESESYWIRLFGWNNSYKVDRVNGWYKNGYYVRCVKD